MKLPKLAILTFCLITLMVTDACARTTPTPTSTTTKDRKVSAQVSRRIDLASDLYLRQIGEGVYVVTYTFPWSANALMVQMDDGTLVFAGMPWSPQATQQLVDWAQKQFGRSKMVAIDTGYHIDNMGGNQAFLEARIPVYGSDLTAKLIQEEAKQSRQTILSTIGDQKSGAYKTALNMTFPPPDHTFPIKAGLVLTFGDESVQVIFPGPSQAPDKVAVYFPTRRLLFGSCMVIGMDQLGNTADADMNRWPEAIKQLERFPSDVIVPGHGDRLGADLLQHTLELITGS
jgi:metallo-beta-lactamase class B